MKKRIVTISRQFGSGGHSIAKAAAERLGIPFYDKELVDQIALESGFAPKFIEEHGEHSPGKSLFSYAFAPQGVPGVMNGLSTADFLWNIQCSVILQLADQGPCVIVGRNADATLFVIRAEVLDRSLLPDIQKYYDEGKLPKMSLILNGTTDAFSYYGNHRYGSRYGYYGGSSYGGYTKDDD